MTYGYRIHLFYSAQTRTYKYIHVNKKDILIYNSNTSQARDSQSQYTGRIENSRANLIKYLKCVEESFKIRAKIMDVIKEHTQFLRMNFMQHPSLNMDLGKIQSNSLRKKTTQTAKESVLPLLILISVVKAMSLLRKANLCKINKIKGR